MLLSLSTTTAGLSTRRFETRTSPILSPRAFLDEVAEQASGRVVELFLAGLQRDLGSLGRGQLLALKLPQMFHDKLVPWIEEEESFVVFYLESFVIRTRQACLSIRPGNVIDLLLVLGHSRDVICDGNRRFRLGSLIAEELRERFALREVADNSLLEKVPEFFEEADVFVGVALSFLLEKL